MRFRQVHLDFHTNENIPGIGTRFDADAFGQAFKDAYVDSVTVFSKCHHGVSYHPTDVGKMHPHLKFDLLRAQIDALHKVGINAPVYLTASWDELAASEHPEWRVTDLDWSMPRFRPEHGNNAGWAFCDFSTPYLDYLCAQTEEVMIRYPEADGIFMDISLQLPSISVSARKEMEREGMDWTNPDQVKLFAERAAENYYARVQQAVHKHNPNMPLFYNSGHIRRGFREHYAKYYSHLEVESLPTAGWGYEHFPLSARYVDAIGTPYLGMTGKFHTHWGEVGGYKLPEAMLYECGAMLAQGARCSIGDHLHPTGQIDKSTMEIIKPAYKWIAEREDWAKDSVNRADVGLLSLESVSEHSLAGMPPHHVHADEGAVRVLLESRFTFDVLDPQSDFEGYRVIILPDAIPVAGALKSKLEAYVAGGGRVLLTGKSGIDDETGFQVDVGAKWHGTSPNLGGDFALAVEDLRAHFVNDPLLMYKPSERIDLTDGESLGLVYELYFDRTAKHFSGHVNAPSKPDPEKWVAGSEKGGFVYFAFPIFTAYYDVGAVAMLEIAENLIDRAMGGMRMLEASLPRAGRATVRHQSAQNRDVVHLMFAAPAQRGWLRGEPIQPIQDLIKLNDIDVTLATSGEVSSVSVVPNGENLSFKQDGGRTSFRVPELFGHQMVEIAYK